MKQFPYKFMLLLKILRCHCMCGLTLGSNFNVTVCVDWPWDQISMSQFVWTDLGIKCQCHSVCGLTWGSNVNVIVCVDWPWDQMSMSLYVWTDLGIKCQCHSVCGLTLGSTSSSLFCTQPQGAIPIQNTLVFKPWAIMYSCTASPTCFITPACIPPVVIHAPETNR